jgi:transposase-like protein
MRLNPQMVDIPRLIESLLEKYSKRDISKTVGVSWQTVYYWQRGVFKPKEISLQKLFDMYENYFKDVKPTEGL